MQYSQGDGERSCRVSAGAAGKYSNSVLSCIGELKEAVTVPAKAEN